MLNYIDKSSLYDQVLKFYNKDKGFRNSIKKMKKIRREGKKISEYKSCFLKLCLTILLMDSKNVQIILKFVLPFQEDLATV